MDFTDPDFDVQKIAQGLGARAGKLTHRTAIRDAITWALTSLGPTFLVIGREP